MIDGVLLPTRTVQEVLPFVLAEDKGAFSAPPAGSGGSNHSSASPLPAPLAASLEAAAAAAPPATAASPGGCYRSIAAALDASPQLTIDKAVAFLAGWDFSHPGLNVTLFLPSGQC